MQTPESSAACPSCGGEVTESALGDLICENGCHKEPSVAKVLRGRQARSAANTTAPEAKYADALERTDRALRNVLAGKPVRDADEILSANAWLLFAAPTEDESRV